MSPSIFFFPATTYKRNFVTILYVDTHFLPLVNETIQRFCFIEIPFTFDYRYCIRVSTLLPISSSTEHTFWSRFFSLSLSFLSLLSSSVYIHIFCCVCLYSRIKQGKIKRMCARFLRIHSKWRDDLLCSSWACGC